MLRPSGTEWEKVLEGLRVCTWEPPLEAFEEQIQIVLPRCAGPFHARPPGWLAFG